MTTIDPNVAVTGASAPVERHDSRLGTTRVSARDGVGTWITTTDHKRIGRLFMGASLLVLIGVAALAVLLGIERIDAGDTMIDADAIGQLFSMYRIVLTLGVVAPLMLGLSLAIVPLQLGARSLAFPRLAAAGFWTWLVGAGLVVGSIAANGGPGGGDAEMVDLFLASHLMVVAGLVAAALSVAASVLSTRAPGMNMRRVPLFSWSALIGSLGLLLMLPVLFGTLVLLTVDHRYSRAAFGANYGIGRWIGFAFTQPATFVYVVPAFGLVADAMATATRRRFVGRGIAFTGIGLVGMALIAGVTQVEAPIRRNVLDSSFGTAVRDLVPFALFHLLPLLGGLVVLATSAFQGRAARPRVISPMVFGLLGVLMIFTGMAGNVLQQIGDAQLAGTVFEEAAWIYVCYGAVLAALGGIVYWAPKLWGRRFDEKKVLPLAALGFLATVLASLPYYIAGFADQPASVVEFDYDGPQSVWNIAVTAGHLLMLLTVLAFAALALGTMRGARRRTDAGDDPWDGQTLEWATSSPAPTANFAEIHTITSPEPLLDLKPATTTTTANVGAAS
jgi:heme/copper-type cytochrome/quinol oxidase subunit 1